MKGVMVAGIACSFLVFIPEPFYKANLNASLGRRRIEVLLRVVGGSRDNFSLSKFIYRAAPRDKGPVWYYTLLFQPLFNG